MTAHEEDVVIAFRQAVEEELRRVQHGDIEHEPAFFEGAPAEENMRRLAARHADLEHEVALLRTIILRLVSDPIDESDLADEQNPA